MALRLLRRKEAEHRLCANPADPNKAISRLYRADGLAEAVRIIEKGQEE